MSAGQPQSSAAGAAAEAYVYPPVWHFSITGKPNIPSPAKADATAKADTLQRERRLRRKMNKRNKRDRDVSQDAPFVPIGQNSNSSELRSLCPKRDYNRCFYRFLSDKYPNKELFAFRSMRAAAAERAAVLFPADGCAASPQASSAAAVGQSFAHFALAEASLALQPSADTTPELTVERQAERAQAIALAARLPSTASPPPASGRLHCDDPATLLNAKTFLMVGVPSSATPVGRKRRDAARSSWMSSPLNGDAMLACFLLSAHYSEDKFDGLLSEARQHRDMLFLQAPETNVLIREKTRYSNFTAFGRHMPTFKQFAFFQLAAAALPAVPFVGKVDDDTAVNAPEMLAVMRRLRCNLAGAPDPWAFIGAINWAAYVPRAHWSGVRGDRCGFGWGLGAALNNFGQSFGKPNTKSFQPACDKIGAVPPFPYGTGAGYFFSSALLRWFAADPDVVGWVAAARGPDREALQWQKFEDTSTGYWLTYARERVNYVNIGRWVHDWSCRPDGEEKRNGGGLYRPASSISLLVHNLKRGGFHYGWQLMQDANATYEHHACQRDKLER